jgi:hypothetical protein
MRAWLGWSKVGAAALGPAINIEPGLLWQFECYIIRATPLRYMYSSGATIEASTQDSGKSDHAAQSASDLGHTASHEIPSYS